MLTRSHHHTLTPSHHHRLLTLWFDFGHLSEVNDALVEGIRTIDIDTWLQVREWRGEGVRGGGVRGCGYVLSQLLIAFSRKNSRSLQCMVVLLVYAT